MLLTKKKTALVWAVVHNFLKDFLENAMECTLEPNLMFSPSLSTNQSLEREQAILSLAEINPC